MCHAMNDAILPHLIDRENHSSQSAWGLIDAYGPTVSRPDDYYDATHPNAPTFAPINAQLFGRKAKHAMVGGLCENVAAGSAIDDSNSFGRKMLAPSLSGALSPRASTASRPRA